MQKIVHKCSLVERMLRSENIKWEKKSNQQQKWTWQNKAFSVKITGRLIFNVREKQLLQKSLFLLLVKNFSQKWGEIFSRKKGPSSGWQGNLFFRILLRPLLLGNFLWINSHCFQSWSTLIRTYLPHYLKNVYTL